MEREFHAAANLFPLLTGAALEELAADIRENGLREPILLDGEGRILDGRNRYRACLAAGVEPRFETWDGEGSPADLALSLNLRRRHLNESQRAMVAAKLAKLLEKPVGRPRKNPAHLQDFPGDSRAHAAKTVNISPRLVAAAVRVLRDGCDELVAAVETGAVAVSPAAVLAGLPQEEQKAVLAGGAAEISRKVRELRGGKAGAVSPGEFGLVVVRAAGSPQSPGHVFLWVAAEGLGVAIDTLKARGFRYVASES